jgi:RNA polymerase sigma factor (sigma-70 family)
VKPETLPRELAWSSERLVGECCNGNQAAWSALIEKYKNLIFSIPIKFGLSRDDAADICQAVCVDLLSDLPRLREPRALPKWLMQASYHKCLRFRRQKLDLLDDQAHIEERPRTTTEELPEEMSYQLQREQMLRDAVATLPARCNRLIGLLFFDEPPRPYQEVAKELKLATGSIGFIRGRCLKLLRQRLEKEGFR